MKCKISKANRLTQLNLKMVIEMVACVCNNNSNITTHVASQVGDIN